MRSQLLLPLAVFVLLLAACGGGGATLPTATPTVTTRQIVDQAREAMLRIDTYQATLELVLTGPGGGDVTMQVAMSGSPVTADTPDQQLRFKGEVISSTLLALPVGTVAVVGPTNLIYDPVQNVAIAGATGVGNSELFNLFLGSQIRVVTLLQPLLADASLVGEETVGSFQTWRLDLTPKPAVAAAALLGEHAQGRAWIDRATDLPVRFEYNDTDVGIRWTVTAMDTITPVSEAQLSFTPPPGARVLDPSELGQVETVDTLEQAIAQTGFTPLVPQVLPGDLAITPTSIGVRTTSLGPMIELSYGIQTVAGNPPAFPGLDGGSPMVTQGITVQALKSPVNLPANHPTSAVITETTVRGQPALEVELSATQVTLSWQEDGIFYTIRSNGFSATEVRQVAESFK